MVFKYFTSRGRVRADAGDAIRSDRQLPHVSVTLYRNGDAYI